MTGCSETAGKLANAETFRDVFQKYCWDVHDIGDIRIAPFHTLAHSTGASWEQTHEWHMEQNREFARISTMMMETEYRVIASEADETDVIHWWDEITAEGHEGIVIKPETFRAWNNNKMIQPAIKVRGRGNICTSSMGWTTWHPRICPDFVNAKHPKKNATP